MPRRITMIGNAFEGTRALVAGSTYSDVSEDLGARLVAGNQAIWTDGPLAQAAPAPAVTADQQAALAANPGVTPALVNPNGRYVAASSTKIGGAVFGFVGASLEEQNYSMYKAAPGTYTFDARTSICSLRTTNPLAILPDQEIGVTKESNPEIEGVFTVLSAASESGGTRITWKNPNGAITAQGDLGNIRVTHRACWNFGSSWMAWMIGFLGGRARAEGVACGGAQLANLAVPTRLGLFIQRGPYDAVFSAGGGVGNASAIGDYSSTEILEQLSSQLRQLGLVTKKAYTAFPHTPIGKTPADGAFTRGLDLNKRMYRELAQRHPFVQIIQTAEVLGSNYSPYASATPAGVTNATPDPEFLNPDGTHYCYRAAWRIGAVFAEAVSPDLQDATPYNNALADNRTVNTALAQGVANRSLIPGRYGQVTPVALGGTGNSGVKPDANWTVVYGSRGGAACVGSVATNPRGGADFVLDMSDTAPSTGGAIVGINWKPPELLAALNNAAIQGKYVDLWMPMAVYGFNDKGLVYAEAKLVATVGGVDYELGGCLTDNPNSDQSMTVLSEANSGVAPRDMGDEGFSGIFRAPRFIVPRATYTDARFVWSVKHNTSGRVPGGPGAYRIVIGPQTKLELVEA